MKKTLLPLSLCFISLFAFVAFAYSPNKNFVKCIAKNKLSNIVYSPSNPLFTGILTAYIKNKRFNRSTTHKPTLILTPTEEEHVSTIVTCAAPTNIQIKIRCGGHDYEGISYVYKDKFIILDMFNLRSISIDVDKKTALVEAGALLGELYYEIGTKSKSLAFPAGICPTVGVGGHFSGGGYGNMLRRNGLSIDNMLSARIVVANGSILNISKGDGLFWAIRGGGGASFGVILSYTIQLVTVEESVTVFRVQILQSENASGILHDYQNIVVTMDKNLFIRVLLQPVTLAGTKNKTLRTTFIGMYVGSAKSLMEEVMRPNFPSLGLNAEDCKEMSWLESVLFWSNFDNKTSPNVLLNRSSDGVVGHLKRKSDYVKTSIDIPSLEKIFEEMVKIGKVGLVFNSYGGVMSEIPDWDSAFPHRGGNLFKIQYSVTWKDPSEEAEYECMAGIRKLYDYMTPYVSKAPRESYLNYRDLDIGTNGGRNSYYVGKVYGESYFKSNYDKLVAIKTAVDPDNFFRNEQSIPTWKSHT